MGLSDVLCYSDVLSKFMVIHVDFDLIMIYSVVKLIHITQGIMFSHEGQTGDKQKIIT